MRVHSLTMGMARAYLLENEAGLYLVDAGSPGSQDKALATLHALRRTDLKLIIITHAHLDHFGSAAAVRRLTGAPIAIHREDAEAMSRGCSPLGEVRGRGRLTKSLMPWVGKLWRLEPTIPDVLFDDGADLIGFGLPATILHTPGHTPGSSCLLLQDRRAFVGDLLSSNGRPHVQRFYAHDWSQIPTSLARLLEVRPEKAYPGHGRKPIEGNALRSLLKEASHLSHLDSGFR